MRMRSRLAAAAFAGVLAASALAAPASAAPRPDGGRFGSGSAIAAMPGVQVLKPGVTNRVELKGKGKAGVDTVITCYVFDWGPLLSGFQVVFEVAVSCEGGIPPQQGANLDMFYPVFGQWVQVPGSVSHCSEINNPFLDCVSRGGCWQAGNYYDGLADLFAFDELGNYHQATLYAPPRWVGCVV